MPGAGALRCASNAHQRLGYFALFGSLRLNCMLGDYHGALASIDGVDMYRRAPLFFRIDSLHLTVQYYQCGPGAWLPEVSRRGRAFCMMMVRRYAGAVRVLSRTLGFLLRARTTQKSEETSRRIDKMFFLLTLCVVMSSTKVGESGGRTL